jgi:hypothetical protein
MHKDKSNLSVPIGTVCPQKSPTTTNVIKLATAKTWTWLSPFLSLVPLAITLPAFHGVARKGCTGQYPKALHTAIFLLRGFV